MSKAVDAEGWENPCHPLGISSGNGPDSLRRKRDAPVPEAVKNRFC